LLPGKGTFARRLAASETAGARCFSRPKVGHVLGELEDSMEVFSTPDVSTTNNLIPKCH